MKDYPELTELMVVHKDSAPEDGDNFIDAEIRLESTITYLSKDVWENVRDKYLRVVVVKNDGHGNSEYIDLTRDNCSFRQMPISSFLRIPMSEKLDLDVIREDERLVFQYTKKTAKDQHLRAILLHHDGKYEHGWSEVLHAFVGSDEATKNAVKEKLKEVVINGFSMNKQGEIFPKVADIHKDLQQDSMSSYDWFHSITYQDILDKAIRVDDPEEIQISKTDPDKDFLKIAKGNVIEAIKLCRRHLNLGLKEAKEYINDLQRKNGLI